MIDELKKNIEAEIEILKEISNYYRAIDYSSNEEVLLLSGAIKSLLEIFSIINDSVPALMEERKISIKELPKIPKLPEIKKRESIEQKSTVLENVKIENFDRKLDLLLNRKDKDRFIGELKISEEFIKKIKKRKSAKDEKYIEFKASRGYLKFGNRLFLNYASKLINKGYFRELPVELRKANLDMLFEVYVSMVFLTTVLSFIFALTLFIFLIFFDLHILWPFITAYSGEFVPRVAHTFWIIIILPIITFTALYYYPSSEKKSIATKIDQELPFAVIHMSAISGSGITPVEIFRIIGNGKEYVALRKEFKKVLNQINIFGYDLITALNNSAKNAPSEKLSELYSGLSTSITSGANLKEFFEKRSETLLMNYRLEREKYTRLVETFLDIYISIVIAAPMIFLLLLVMIFISGIEVQLSSGLISVIFVGGVALLNIVFLVFLQTKQPAY
mgnify:CR=1 FL=1